MSWFIFVIVERDAEKGRGIQTKILILRLKMRYFIQFGSNASRGLQNCRNVTVVTGKFFQCRNCLVITVSTC